MAAGEHERVEAAPAPAEAAAAPAASQSVTPGPLTPQRVLGLQRSAGNASVARMLGAPGEAGVRARTEAATGFDLSAARVTPASPAADALGVEALTIGREVHLGSAASPPGTAHGDHVLAHELAHVVQQATGVADLTVPGRADALERDAERTADVARSTTPGAALRPLPTAAPAAQAYDPRYHRRALVRGLQGSGFADADIGKIYAANWERDMSQAHPALAAVALRWKEIKMAAVEGERPLEPRIQAFNAAVDHCLELGTLLNLKSGEAYGGYRFFEHMDNPGAEPTLDPSTAKDEAERQRREAARAHMLADAGGIPQYMADGRDYIKAQLVRAAEVYKGTAFGADSVAGQTRDAWTAREEALRHIVPHDPDRPIITGQDPSTDVIARETAHQSAELRAAPPGSDYDGERVVPPVAPPEVVPAPDANGGAPSDVPTFERKPLTGPVFHTEVDRRFWAQNPERAGQRLDPQNPDDAPYIQKWLTLRDQVRAEWARENDARARAAAEEAIRRKQAADAAAQQANGGTPAPDGGGTQPPPPHAPDLPPAAADALGRASHALEDFWSHSNFIELTLGIRLQDVNPGKTPLTGSPGDVNTKLQTSTFSGTDTMHSLSHKIRAVADEIEAEIPLVNRVTGKTDVDPEPEDISRYGSEAPVTETDEPGESIGDARKNDPTMRDAEGRVRGGAIRGGVTGGLLGGAVGFGLLGIPGAIIGGLIGAGIGAFKGAQSGIKEAAREVIATPAGVALLRRLAEGLEDETRANQEEGGHSQIAKDQPGHHGGDPLNDLRTFRFEVSQECAVRADTEVMGGMRRVLDAPAERIDAEMQAQIELVDHLIGPPAGHPYEAMVKRHQPRAEEIMTALMATHGGGAEHEPAGAAH